jgi:predicted nuclease of predicted toxin-antitoxin system
VKLSDCLLLADENIDPKVIAFLRVKGQDVACVTELGLVGEPDEEILRTATMLGRVVLTHDRDLSELAVARRQPARGVILVRPGHMHAAHTIGTLEAAWDATPELDGRFVVVIERHDSRVSCRVRRLEE